MKQLAKLCTLFLGCLMVLPALAQEPFVEGTHYSRLANPVPVRDTEKIEVAEIFSYACGHCYTFESLLQSWKKDLPDDVAFERLHVNWNRPTEIMARALYTAEALGVEEKVTPAIFRAMHVERQRIDNQAQIAEIFTKQGVDEEVFEKTFNSFGITSQLRQGESKISGARVNSTPTLLVNGRYVINASREVDHETMLEVADYLVEKIREERGG